MLRVIDADHRDAIYRVHSEIRKSNLLTLSVTCLLPIDKFASFISPWFFNKDRFKNVYQDKMLQLTKSLLNIWMYESLCNLP